MGPWVSGYFTGSLSSVSLQPRVERDPGTLGSWGPGTKHCQLKDLREKAEHKGLKEGGPKGLEAPKGCSLLKVYADQKERKRGRESLSHILWTFYPSFTTVFIINKYDTYAFCLESATKQECHTA